MESVAWTALPLASKKKQKIAYLIKLVLVVSVLGVVFAGDDVDVLEQEGSHGTNGILEHNNAQQISDLPKHEGCNIFDGQWVPNPSGPLYSNTTCNFIDAADNCLKNGRPDTEYLYFKWKPYHCDLPPFDPVIFMNLMRDKSWALIGDSILRNQMQSLICLVSLVEEPIEVYHDKSYKSRTFYFRNHNFTIATKWSPFLVKSVSDEDDDGKGKNDIQLFLDTLDSSWTSDYHKYDYILISGGQWFLKTAVMWEDNMVIGCHNCKDKNMNELGVYYPYQKALNSALNFIATSTHKPLVIFRTWTPDHFEFGQWFNGGVCNRSEPFVEGQYNGSLCDQKMRDVELEEYSKARDVGTKRGVHMELLDVFHLSALRADGHPGPYRTFHPKSSKVQNDCLHWCVPGPVDTWNDLMMKILSNSENSGLSMSYNNDDQGYYSM